MIKKRRVETYMRSVLKKKVNTERTIYVFILFSSIFLSVYYGSKIEAQAMLTVISKEVVIFLLALSVFSGIFYLTTETHKIQSVNALMSSIPKITFNDWEWIKMAMVDRPIPLHPVVKTHPVALVVVALLFRGEGFEQEAVILFNKAGRLDPDLSSLNICERFNEKNIQYLYEKVSSEEEFKSAHILRRLWKRKNIRYGFLFIVGLIIALHFLSQIYNNF